MSLIVVLIFFLVFFIFGLSYLFYNNETDYNEVIRMYERELSNTEQKVSKQNKEIDSIERDILKTKRRIRKKLKLLFHIK